MQQPRQLQQKLDHTFQTAKTLLQKSQVVTREETAIAALLMIGQVSEPMPTEVLNLKEKLVSEGFL